MFNIVHANRKKKFVKNTNKIVKNQSDTNYVSNPSCTSKFIGSSNRELTSQGSDLGFETRQISLEVMKRFLFVFLKKVKYKMVRGCQTKLKSVWGKTVEARYMKNLVPMLRGVYEEILMLVSVVLTESCF